MICFTDLAIFDYIIFRYQDAWFIPTALNHFDDTLQVDSDPRGTIKPIWMEPMVSFYSVGLQWRQRLQIG